MLNKNKLLGIMVSKGLTQKDLSIKMSNLGCKMSENTLSSRINSNSAFDIIEAETICEILEINEGADRAEIFLASVSQ